MNEAFTVRLATLDDLPTLVAHRRAMFVDMGYTDRAALDAMEIRFCAWVERRMQAGDYLTWLTVDAATQAVAAGAALWLQDWPAGPIPSWNVAATCSTSIRTLSTGGADWRAS